MIKRIRVSLPFVAVFSSLSVAAAPLGREAAKENPRISIAVLGDNLATGAGSSPLLKYDADLLWDIFKKQNLTIPLVPEEIAAFTKGAALTQPETLWLTEREYAGSFSWVFKHFWASFARVYLDTEEYSWGYLTAKALGAPSKQIFLAAEDGARISMLPRQIDRILHGRQGQLPQKIFILFTFNDICALHPDEMTSFNDYYLTMVRSLQYLMRNGKAAPEGTEVYVLGALGMTQLLTKPSILNKEVVAHGETTTCADLRSRSYQPVKPSTSVRHMESLYFQHLLPPNPARICPSLFAQKFIAQNDMGFFSSLNKKNRGKKIDTVVSEMLSSVSGRIRSYRSAAQRAVSEVQSWQKKEKISGVFSLHYVEDSEMIEFEGEDIADDCFHLNWRGQLKIAKVLYSKILGTTQK